MVRSNTINSVLPFVLFALFLFGMAAPREVAGPYGEKKHLSQKGVGAEFPQMILIYSPTGEFDWQIGEKLEFQVQVFDENNDSTYIGESAPGKGAMTGFTPIPGLTRHHVKKVDITPLYYDFAGWKPGPYTIQVVAYDKAQRRLTASGAIVTLKN